MRNDFEGVFYQIECSRPDRDNGKFMGANLDHFGDGHPDFSASGKCWQQTGHHGTFILENGITAITALANEHKGYIFRLVARKVSWKTEVAATIHIA